MPGPPPKPTHLRLIEGKRNRHPGVKEPAPKRGIPAVPAHLSGEAKAEWHRIARELNTIGLLTRIDRAALAGYCQAWADWVEAEDQLAKYGKVVKSPVRTVTRRKHGSGDEETEHMGGVPMASPFLSIRNRALEFMHKFLVEFGMTPASRSRISVENGPKIPQADRAARYLGGR